MTRLEANKAILEQLSKLIDENPHLRFSQILSSFGFVKRNDLDKDGSMPDWTNEFYVESEDILKRVKNSE